MRRIRHLKVVRWLARALALLCLVLWHCPPASAFTSSPRPPRTQTPDADQRAQIAAREERQRHRYPPLVRALPAAEMASLRGRGPYRNRFFCGVLPWQRSFRDVNLANGNLFKSFSDIQVSPAKGAGLAWQRTYNSQDDRIGPFGIGWTHAYDIRMEEEAGSVNKSDRVDFFGGKHRYTRDADGLYSPPPYLFDELSSNYDEFLVNGPPEILADEQRG